MRGRLFLPFTFLQMLCIVMLIFDMLLLLVTILGEGRSHNCRHLRRPLHSIDHNSLHPYIHGFDDNSVSYKSSEHSQETCAMFSLSFTVSLLAAGAGLTSAL